MKTYTITVNGKAYAASGRGAVVLFNEDGSLKKAQQQLAHQ